MEQIADFHDCKGLYEKNNQTLFINVAHYPLILLEMQNRAQSNKEKQNTLAE